ncbi:Lysophospholipase L1 [Planctomycetales bacterium 10988]|nr:Lysophospholipase L1 [Planctomycetales bacterium 10988]
MPIANVLTKGLLLGSLLLFLGCAQPVESQSTAEVSESPADAPVAHMAMKPIVDEEAVVVDIPVEGIEVEKISPENSETEPLWTPENGEKIAFLGGTLIERAQQFGYLETLLVRRFPDKDLSLRNLGWSGDNPQGHARVGFDKPETGIQEMQEHLDLVKPEVVFVSYRPDAALSEETDDFESFEKSLNDLIDRLEKQEADVVILSPPPVERERLLQPDPQGTNERLEKAVASLQKIAEERELPFVDFFHQLEVNQSWPAEKPLMTSNGLHLNAAGYWQLAMIFEESLGLTPATWEVAIDLEQQKATTAGTELSELKEAKSGFSFQLKDAFLPTPLAPSAVSAADESPRQALPEAYARKVIIAGLPAGMYALTVDEQTVAKGTAEDWAGGILVQAGPEFDQAEALRQVIVKKDELFFHQWRPQNWTYLYGFRKHEQGQNAAEVERFVDLVKEQEAEIAKLRVPQAHQYQLQRVE